MAVGVDKVEESAGLNACLWIEINFVIKEVLARIKLLIICNNDT